jgi:hypothetical protein
MTLFRKGPVDLERSAQQQPQTPITKDGFLVPGKEFFNSFHLETEENQNAVSIT